MIINENQMKFLILKIKFTNLSSIRHCRTVVDQDRRRLTLSVHIVTMGTMEKSVPENQPKMQLITRRYPSSEHKMTA